MGLFYDARPASNAAGAVGDNRTGNLPNPKWGRLIGAFLIAVGLFVLALVFENTGHEEASKTLLRVFEVAFTALLALLGIETAKA